jgi:hypothetical protein
VKGGDLPPGHDRRFRQRAREAAGTLDARAKADGVDCAAWCPPRLPTPPERPECPGTAPVSGGCCPEVARCSEVARVGWVL